MAERFNLSGARRQERIRMNFRHGRPAQKNLEARILDHIRVTTKKNTVVRKHTVITHGGFEHSAHPGIQRQGFRAGTIHAGNIMEVGELTGQALQGSLMIESFHRKTTVVEPDRPTMALGQGIAHNPVKRRQTRTRSEQQQGLFFLTRRIKTLTQ
jgi:hypothetical protein